ncbi:helix-turn-helix domain-containing protein [Sporosarcina sp. FSL K6-5500]|uniref:helix-turn-helix domain-containing protein n=1 Tax=Sporosarcina sp. FSL K6-5500 TaxID=2921558 RepID=UPI0030FB4BED
MNFGSFLITSRKAVNLTQEQIAPLVNISRSTISKLERDEMTLKAEDLIRWLQVVQSKTRMSSNTTPLEAGISLIHGVDIVALSQMLTNLVGGVIYFMGGR